MPESRVPCWGHLSLKQQPRARKPRGSLGPVAQGEKRALILFLPEMSGAGCLGAGRVGNGFCRQEPFIDLPRLQVLL